MADAARAAPVRSDRSAPRVLGLHAEPFKELRLEGVRRDFGNMSALRDLTLGIARGEFVALLGPSGCGKSTALNCIAGLLPVTGGSIWLDDKRIDTLRTEERGFGMVFQNYALFPHMTVRRNIGFGLKMRGVPGAESEKRVDEALRLVHLAEHAHKLPGQLSGGQQQRVAIARAIVIEPPLVLMDEPLSNLDAKLRLEMRQEIRRIHGQLGSTTIYVTHDQEEALSLADRIVVLREGSIRQVGTPAGALCGTCPSRCRGVHGLPQPRRRQARPRRGRHGGCRYRRRRHRGPRAGRSRRALGERVIAAMRPDDLVPSGRRRRCDRREHRVSRARIPRRGAHRRTAPELHFASPVRLETGAAVKLAAEPRQVLIFAGTRRNERHRLRDRAGAASRRARRR